MLGLPGCVLLWVVATLWLAPAIEHDIRRETIRFADREPGSPLARYRARAEVDGRDVRVVADQGLSDELRAATEADLRRIRGVRSVRTVIAAPVAMSPFKLTIRRTATGIALLGGVPAAEIRASLVEQAATLVPADSVDDRLELATGAPPGFAAAAATVLAMVGRSSTADATLSDGVLGMRAAAPDTPSYEAIRAGVAGLPVGFTPGLIEISPPLADPFTWMVRRDGGGIVFGGAVPSEAVRAQVSALAGDLLPGVPVRDDMRTARGLARGIDFLALARSSLTALASLQAGSGELIGRRFSFSGESVARALLDGVRRQIRAALPTSIDIERIDVRAVAASPFRFVARRGDGLLTLSGYVPDESLRKSSATVVTTRFPGERLVDQRIVADGAPAGFDVAERVALETLSDFAEGEAAITDRELQFSGRILYRQLAARVREAVPRLAPAGWTARISLDPGPVEQAIDPTLCGDLLADSAKLAPVRFEADKAEPSPASRPALDATADIVRRCGNVGIRVIHRVPAGHDGDAARKLASERATALVAALAERVEGARLSGEGAESIPPVTATERTDFIVTPR